MNSTNTQLQSVWETTELSDLQSTIDLKKWILSCIQSSTPPTLKEWVEFSNLYATFFLEICTRRNIEKVKVQVKTTLTWNWDKIVWFLKEKWAKDYGARMIMDPHATAELLDAIMREDLAPNDEAPWFDLGTGSGILAAGMRLRSERDMYHGVCNTLPKIIAVDCNSFELSVAEQTLWQLGMQNIHYQLWNLEDRDFLNCLLSEYWIPNLVACELVGNRKNFLYEAWDTYVSVMMYLHSLFEQRSPDISASVRIVPATVVASIFNNMEHGGGDFWRNSPIYTFSLQGATMAVWEQLLNEESKRTCDRFLDSFNEMYTSSNKVVDLKKVRAFGLFALSLTNRDWQRHLWDIGGVTRPGNYSGPRRWD